MHITKVISKTILAASLLVFSPVIMAHSEHQHSDLSQPSTIVHHQHEQAVPLPEPLHDHRKEHGAQRYVITTFDQVGLVNRAGDLELKSELETHFGTDEHKVFIKLHADKQQSHSAHYDAKILYSRMYSEFWDAQLGMRYEHEKVESMHTNVKRVENVYAVVGLHGLAPFFLETDVYGYFSDRYASVYLETERDFLITQKLIMQPYLEAEVVLVDESKHRKSTGLNAIESGAKLRYEVSKKIVPYFDVRYQYEKALKDHSKHTQADSEWLYGLGVQLTF